MDRSIDFVWHTLRCLTIYFEIVIHKIHFLIRVVTRYLRPDTEISIYSPGTATPDTSLQVFSNSSCLLTFPAPGCADSSPLVVQNEPLFKLANFPCPTAQSASALAGLSFPPGAIMPPILVLTQPGCMLTTWILSPHRRAKALASITSCNLLLP